MTDLHDTSDLEALYGKLARYSDHKRGQRVRYKDIDGSIQTGVIIWICERAVRVEGKPEVPQHYVVENDYVSWPDTVFPSDIVIEE